MNLLRQYNKFASMGNNLIEKALTSATNVGEALVPQHLEKVITTTLTYLLPEMAIINPKFDSQKSHEFNRLTALPGPGGAMGEGAVTPTRNATYARDSVNLKVIRRKGAVTNFLQDSSANYADASAIELQNHLYAHALDLAFYNYFGNELANTWEHGGLDRFVNGTNRTNQVVGGAVPTSLSFLDNLIDQNTRKQGAPHKKCFIMSPEMLSKVSNLLTNVRLSQGIVGQGLTEVEIPGGWRLNAYRNIPIIESSFTRPQTTMGVVTPSTATSGGTIANGTYYFSVSKVTYNGEQLASAEVSQVAGGSNTSTITLTWTAETDALQYRIYSGSSAGVKTLVKIVSAFTYDGSGTINGNKTSHTFTANPTTAGAEIVGTMANDVPLQLSGGGAQAPETIYLWDLDEFQGLGKYAYTNVKGSKFNGLVTIEELAKTDDDLPFLVKTYGALVPSFADTSFIARGYKIA